MRFLLVVALATALSACMPPKKPTLPPAANLASELVPGCYTVDLFDPYRIKYPEQGVPPEHVAFLGVWKDGGWGKTWCHDLYITEVRADGTVILLDAHGPDRKRGIEAQVFKRTAQLQNGVLTFVSIGKAPVSYRIENGYLVGERKEFRDPQRIVLNQTRRVARVPVPPRNPRRS